MAANEIHKGDIGTVFEVTVKDGDTVVDVSSASTEGSKKIRFSKPGGTVVEETATFSSNGTDGKIRYVTIADDLDTAGVWKWQAYVVLSSGTWNSDVKEFTVHPNLEVSA